MLSPCRAVSGSLAKLPGEISGAGLVILAAPACGTGGRREPPLVGGHTEAPDLSGTHNRQGAAAATPERVLFAAGVKRLAGFSSKSASAVCPPWRRAVWWSRVRGWLVRKARVGGGWPPRSGPPGFPVARPRPLLPPSRLCRGGRLGMR